jgi:hypothetical protein
MQRSHALEVALKDRPRVFQVVVLCVFSLSVLAVIVCAVYSLQGVKVPAHAIHGAKQPFSQPVYTSLPTANR